MRLTLTLAAVLSLAVLVACGGDDDGESVSATATPASGTPSATLVGSPTAIVETPASTSSVFTPRVTPTPAGPAPGDDPQGDRALYLSLGDSLAEGIGATDPRRTAWVPLVAYALEPDFELLNLGVAGDDSEELIEEPGRLDRALAEIATRANDGIPGNEVGLITLEIGGNDLLDLYDSLVLTGDCPSVEEALERQHCIDGLRAALDNYRPNLERILDELTEAAPGVPIYLMTLYNPFSGGSEVLDTIGVLALEGQDGTPFPEGLNDTIRSVAGNYSSVTLVEWYELFLGKQREYIYQDLIHPNDTGHRVMADAVLAAMGVAGSP